MVIPKENLNIEVTLQLLPGICSALWYLHSRHPPVVHGDLKASDIMVEMCRSEVTPKLLDFGLSRGYFCTLRAPKLETVRGQRAVSSRSYQPPYVRHIADLYCRE